MSLSEVLSVRNYRNQIDTQLNKLAQARQTSCIEPLISESDCTPLLEQLQGTKPQNGSADAKQVQYAAIETIFREDFYSLLATTDINDAAFSQVWILLDLATILADRELCEPALALWLIEELLESQTIDGCRKVFDYLESRRERIKSKHFKHKSLVLLRFCNDLLRRLSRAEDTVFCGRVFIFLFQSFPLGDKSSVNLRGEFHVENATIFDPVPQKSEGAIKPMEIDSEGGRPVFSRPSTPTSSTTDLETVQKTGRSTPSLAKSTTVDEPPDLDALYPIFWSLQAFFSSPTKLFDRTSMASFKSGIAATLSVFQKMHSTSSSSGSSSDNMLKRGTKRKHSETTSAVSVSAANTFNPKYLTNRDLFDLEVRDLAFRRHILVQGLIIIDFLLSLTPSSKAKLADLTNKSVLYSFTLTDEDAKWATTTRNTIATYLQSQGNGNEGKFYHRMVDTVLSRDKNWVRWKAENCPPISRPPVDVKLYIQAQENLAKICKRQNLPTPPGAEEMAFLTKHEHMDALKYPDRRMQIPTMEEFYRGIQNDELDMEMGTEEEISAAREARDAKVWKALRSSGRRFVLCERIANGKNLAALVGKGVDDKSNDDEGLKMDGAGDQKENDMDFDGAGDVKDDKEVNELNEEDPSKEESIQGYGNKIKDEEMQLKEEVIDAPLRGQPDLATSESQAGG